MVCSARLLGLENIKSEFNNRLTVYFKEFEIDAIEMANKSYNIFYSQDYDTYISGESVGERSDRLLNKDLDFMTSYKKNTEETND